MSMPHLRFRTLLALPLALAVACGGGDDRDALEQDELGRELDLALQGDSVPTTFEDTAVTAEPAPSPTPPPPPAPRPRPQTPPPAPPPPPVTPPPAATPPAPPPAPRTVTSTVGVGTNMTLTLNETLSTESNQVGDGFMATVDAPVYGTDGEVVIPAGARVRGRVTQVQKSGRAGETAVLGVAFETVSFGGDSYPLDATVVQANPERVGRASTGETAGKVAVGAAAGAILGRILGKDTKCAIIGGAVGAAAGTAIAMGTSDVDAVLREGSTMVIKIDSPVSVERPVG
jgi:hypothetical protein